MDAVATVPRGRKRRRSQIEGESDGQSEKRRKTESPWLVVKFKSAFERLYKYWFGGTMSNDTENDSRCRDSPDTDEDEIRIVHDSREEKERAGDGGEVSVVRDVIASPELAGFRFAPAGNSTVIGSSSGKSAVFVTTKEKRAKERKVSIVQQLREKKITARQNFAFSPANWRSPFAPTSAGRPALVKRLAGSSAGGGRPVSSPRSRTAIHECFRMDELKQYQSVLEKVIDVEPDYLASVGRATTFNRSFAADGRTPMFQRSLPASSASFAGGAVTRSQLEQSSNLAILRRLSRKSAPDVITLDDDDGVEEKKPPSTSLRPRPAGPDSDVIEILDAISPPKPKASPKKRTSPARVNTLMADMRAKEVFQPDFLKGLRDKYDKRMRDTDALITEERVRADYAREHSERMAKSVEERLRKHLAITEVAIPEPAEEEGEEEEPTELPEMTADMEADIERSLSSPPSKTLVDSHNIAISRKDLDTLRGLNWLNDEIINFYLQMIVERGAKHDNWPKVYAMNTFFLPKLRSSGYPMIRRWTKKVDLFAYDLILVPVHLDVHWCLSTIDLRDKAVRFYDSMGSDKDDILRLLLRYLEQEHADKKKADFDTSGFELENVKAIPRQMNGSDCGMFTLKYAEYLSRNAAITFTQEDMPYFRRRMVYEIVHDTVIHP